MSNIQDIKNVPELEQKLSGAELLQYGKFSNKNRKLQYLLSHAKVKDVCGENVIVDKNSAPIIKSGFISIAHKDNWVIVAVSDSPVGVDIENTTINRDFIGESELLNLPKPKNKQDFYKNFVEYEARIKFGADAEKANSYFYEKGDYLICVCSIEPQNEISFCSE